jgi:hypothetical protein
MNWCLLVSQSTAELYRQAQKMSANMGLPELDRSFWDSSKFKKQCPSEMVAACSDEGVRWVIPVRVVVLNYFCTHGKKTIYIIHSLVEKQSLNKFCC